MGLVDDSFVWKNGALAAVSFTFDDARISQIDLGLALFAESGILGTFYVSPQLLMKRLSGWRMALRSGHEIGCHTLNHPCSGNFPFSKDKALENYSLDAMIDECELADEFILEHLGVSPETFAYPCGQTFVGRGRNTRSYVPLIAERYRAGRAYRSESANDPGFCDLSRLTSFASDGEPAQDMIGQIESAVEAREWVIFAGHEIGNPQNYQTTGIDVLKEVFEYIKRNRKVIFAAPVAEAAKYLIDCRGRMEA